MTNTIKRIAAVLLLAALAISLAAVALADMNNGYAPDGNVNSYNNDLTGDVLPGDRGNSGTAGNRGDMGGADGIIGDDRGNNGMPGSRGGDMGDGIMDAPDGDMGGDMLPPDKTLGDTDGDGMIEGPMGRSAMDGRNAPGTDTGRQPAGAAGAADDTDGSGFSWWGLLLAVLIAAAVIVLIVVLLPKSGHTDDDKHSTGRQ